MGQTQNRYSAPFGEKREGESHVYRHPGFVNGLNDNFRGMQTLQELLIKNADRYGKNTLLGTQVVTGQNSRHYVYKTYRECFDIARNIGQGIIKLNLIPNVQEYEGRTLKMVGAFSKNREEWMLLEYANFLYGNTMIPLYDTLGPDTIPYVLNQSQISTIFCSAPSVLTLLKVADLGNLKAIVSFDALTEETVASLQSKGLSVYTWQDIIDAGKSVEPIPFAKVTPDDIFTFSYTSGTTGNPKGVMISHLNMIVTVASIVSRDIILGETDVHLSYLPLPHVFERVFNHAFLAYGGTICFYSGDVMKLNQDLALVKPTIFASVPRLYQRLYQTIKEKLDKLEGYKKTMADYAYNTKKYYLQNGGHVTHRLWDKMVFSKTKEAFGGRVRYMITASAPISGEILDFIKIVACCPVLEGYGQTESTGGSFLTHPSDPLSDHVGGPLSHTEFKLVDVPEMKYTSTDVDEQGRPQPRGEICFRGPSLFKGYYKEHEKTKEALDDEGWLHSGDVGVLLPNGSVKIVDRKKNIFKLSQGEYIAPEKLENIYMKVKGVQEAFVYGDSLQCYCIAIIVPKREHVEHLAKEKGIISSYEELCKSKDILQHYQEALDKQGKIDGLNGMEKVKKVYLEPTSFVDHGCMTNTMKLQRHLAKTQFKKVIDELYKE